MLSLLFLQSLLLSQTYAQIVLRGRVTDCRTGEPLAFVNLLTADKLHGTSTDIDGRFSLEVSRVPLQVNLSYVGYETLHQWISSPSERLKLEMCPSVLVLSEVVIMPWDNPALAVIRKVIANRHQNDPSRLSGYRCKAYGKMVFTADTSQLYDARVQVPDTTMEKIRKFMREQHFFLMETVSERIYAKGRLHEKVIGSRVAGFNDPMFVFLISQIQSFSFYEDLIKISDKSYVNPVSPAGFRKYFFSMQDTLYPGNDTVYVISYKPVAKSRFDAMKGLLYINTDGWAVQNVTAEPAEEERGISIAIRQRYARSGNHWFPAELGTTLLLRNVVIQNFLLKGEGSYYLRDIEINPEMKRGLIRKAEIEVMPQATRRDSAFWVQNRMSPLDEMEQRTYVVIDSIGRESGFDKLGKRLDAVIRGRYPIGFFELDLERLVRYNAYEKGYFGLGLWTGSSRIPHVKLGAYIGYGLSDHTWKYGGELRTDVFADLEMEIFARASDDLQEQGGTWSPQRPGQNMFQDYRMMLVNRMDKLVCQQAGIQLRPFSDMLLSISFEREHIQYASPYRFAIYQSDVKAFLHQSDLLLSTLEVRYAYRERRLQGSHGKVSYGSSFPVLWLRLRRSLDTPAGSSYPFTSMEVQADMQVTFPLLGVSDFRLVSGISAPGVPASYLFYGKANFELYSFYSPASFSTMRMNEFLSNRFVYLFYTHDFKHLLTGRRNFPSVQYHLNAGWGSIADTVPHAGIAFDIMDRGYWESGILLPDILNVSIINLGMGAFWRFGYYRLPKSMDNFSWKIHLGLKL